MKVQCHYKDCLRDFDVPDDCQSKIFYCSIECACYDGTYSVTKGWLDEKVSDAVQEKLDRKDKFVEDLGI
jgi:hypothetical protein